jgi:hypothetical protein
MEPPSKSMKASCGVFYKDPKKTLEGEPFPEEKGRMTRSQFNEIA